MSLTKHSASFFWASPLSMVEGKTGGLGRVRINAGLWQDLSQRFWQSKGVFLKPDGKPLCRVGDFLEIRRQFSLA